MRMSKDYTLVLNPIGSERENLNGGGEVEREKVREQGKTNKPLDSLLLSIPFSSLDHMLLCPTLPPPIRSLHINPSYTWSKITLLYNPARGKLATGCAHAICVLRLNRSVQKLWRGGLEREEERERERVREGHVQIPNRD